MAKYTCSYSVSSNITFDVHVSRKSTHHKPSIQLPIISLIATNALQDAFMDRDGVCHITQAGQSESKIASATTNRGQETQYFIHVISM